MASAVQTRSVKIHTRSEGQSIDIPKEFALRGEEATISQDAQGRLIVESTKPKSLAGLLALLESLEPLGEEDAMPVIEELPLEPVNF